MIKLYRNSIFKGTVWKTEIIFNAIGSQYSNKHMDFLASIQEVYNGK